LTGQLINYFAIWPTLSQHFFYLFKITKCISSSFYHALFQITYIYFARGGKVYSAKIPREELVKQTLPTANEGEYLIRYGREGFIEVK
jgi:hypothetical protein